MTFVVDTNVAIVANGRGTHADEQCQLACVQRLKSLTSLTTREVVAIDDADRVLEEYRKYLNYSREREPGKREPGMGDEFFMHVFNQYQGKYVRRIAVTPTEDDGRGFEELPENTLDPSDRKFLAVAVAAEAVLLNATDSDWGAQRVLLDELGVEVGQLCPRYASKQARRGR